MIRKIVDKAPKIIFCLFIIVSLTFLCYKAERTATIVEKPTIQYIADTTEITKLKKELKQKNVKMYKLKKENKAVEEHNELLQKNLTKALEMAQR